MTAGAKNAITDVPGIKVGHATDSACRTGVTLVLPERACVAAADVRGGGPGTRETDALALTGLVGMVDAIVLSGGSVYGLGAADAVAAALGAQRRGFSLVADAAVPVSPIVPAAILYDLNNGGNKAWGETPPYAHLGRGALAAVGDGSEVGAIGAGTGARAGAHPGGLGTASIKLAEGWTVGAIVAVNSFGSPYVPGTRQFWSAPFELGAEFGGRGVASASGITGMPPDTKLAGRSRENTTIAVIATDAPLSRADCQRVAIMAQDGLARAIRPIHAPTDGDTIFALSTAEAAATPLNTLGVLEIGNAAADVLARAVARGVFAAEAVPA